MITDWIKSFQALPITVFLIIARLYKFSDLGWQYAFIAGSIIAIIQTLFLRYEEVILDRFLLAINIFLFGGALGFVFNVDPLLEIYQVHKQALIFVILLGVGLVTTFATDAGYVGIQYLHHDQIRRASLKLLGATAVACVLAFYVQDYGILFAGILILFLKVFNSQLIMNLREAR